MSSWISDFFFGSPPSPPKNPRYRIVQNTVSQYFRVQFFDPVLKTWVSAFNDRQWYNLREAELAVQKRLEDEYAEAGWNKPRVVMYYENA